MFRYLKAEMVKTGITREVLASELGITQSTLSLKLTGKAPVLLREAYKIKMVLGTKLTIEELFAPDSSHKSSA